MQFVLTVLDDGHAILTTERNLSRHEVADLMRAYEEWQATPAGLAIISQCRVQRVSTFEIELAPAVVEAVG